MVEEVIGIDVAAEAIEVSEEVIGVDMSEEEIEVKVAEG